MENCVKTQVKKSLPVILAILLGMFILGCGKTGESAETQTAAAGREAVEGLLEGFKNVDLAAIDQYATTEAVSDSERNVFDPETSEINLYHSMGLLRDNVAPDVQQRITTLCDKMRSKYLEEYEILSVDQENGASEYITVEMTYGYDVDNFLQGDELSAEFQKIMTDYTDNHMEEITKVLNEQGEDALYQKILTDTLPDMLKIIENEVDNGEPVTVTKVFHAQRFEEAWVVTEIN